MLMSWKTSILSKKDCKKISRASRKVHHQGGVYQDLTKSTISTFEQYASEVETGKLEWSPPHRSDVFWKENAHKLEENNYQLLKMLARLLSSSNNALVLAIGASDIGYYVKFATKTGKK